MDQSRIKRCWDDIVTSKRKVFPIGQCNFIRHLLAGQLGKRVSASNFHLIVDCTGVNVQCATEQIWKAQNIVHLVWIVTAPCGNDGIDPHFVCLFWCDLRIRVRHCKDNWIVRHAGDHRRGYGTFRRNAQENITTFHRLVQCACVCDHRMR